jgi:TonB family protein
MLLISRRVPLILSLGALACASSGTPIRSPMPLRAQPTSCVSSIGTDTTVYDITEIDEKPVFRSAMKLTYPSDALQQKAEGRVVVGAIVNAKGDVDQSSVTVLRGVHPSLDAEAARIVATATLWPACRSGQAVRMRMAVPFDFEARGPVFPVSVAIVVGVVAGALAGAALAHTK